MLALILAGALTFTMPDRSVGRYGPCVIDSAAPPAHVARLNLYMVSRDTASVNFNHWILWRALKFPAGSKDGKPQRFDFPAWFFIFGDTMGVWCQVADSSNNWQTNCGRKEWRQR